MFPLRLTTSEPRGAKVAGMVTKIGSGPSRLYIAELRAKAGLTQQVLGDRVGVNKGTISRWEKGHRRPTLAYIAAIADAFSIKTPALFVDPARPTANELMNELSPQDRARAVTFIDGLKRTGS